MNKIKVGLIQINNSFSHQNYFPYSVGILQAFLQKHLRRLQDFEFVIPIYKRIPIDAAVEKLWDMDLLAFSTYVWNIKISLEIARRVKELRPEVLVIFGGPMVPEKTERVESFLRQHRYVDIICHGEGEIPFLGLLENYTSREWEAVPSVSYINKADRLIRNPKSSRISDLNKVPSPYLEGVFAPLKENNVQETWVALWETNRGCPFSCTFCDWGSVVHSQLYAYDLRRLSQEIDWFSQNKIEFIFCCDANFGIMERDFEIVQYIAANKKRYGYPKAFSVQNTKNSTERTYNIQKALSDAGMNKGVTLSLQSLNPATLEAVKRKNISIETFKELQHKFTLEGIETYTDIILGLPNETYETFTEGVASVIENGQHNRIQFNNLVSLDNSEMGDSEYQKDYGICAEETKIINIHGNLNELDDIYETQKLVLATNTMPKADWVRVRVFSWMAALLYFNKVLQIPFIILHHNCLVSFKDLIEIFTTQDIDSSVIFQIRKFFLDKAMDIQNKGPEYCQSKEWLNIWWPADEFMLIKLCQENKLMDFYEEAEYHIVTFLRKKAIDLPVGLLHELILLNHKLLKLPFQNTDFRLSLTFNIWDVYKSSLKGKFIPIENGVYEYLIDRSTNTWSSWDQWYREVIWYGNKKGAYLYDCKLIEQGNLTKERVGK